MERAFSRTLIGKTKGNEGRIKPIGDIFISVKE